LGIIEKKKNLDLESKLKRMYPHKNAIRLFEKYPHKNAIGKYSKS